LLSDVLLLIIVIISIHLFLKSIDKEIERGQRFSSFLAACLLLPSIIAFYNNYSFLDLALFLVLLFLSFSLSLLFIVKITGNFLENLSMVLSYYFLSPHISYGHFIFHIQSLLRYLQAPIYQSIIITI